MEAAFMTQTILAWSGGKDSTASGILAKLHKLPLDGIVTVQPDPYKAEAQMIERFESFMEMPVEVIPGPMFEDFFYRVKVKGANEGGIYGWPKMYQRACSRYLKWQPQEHWQSKNPNTVMIVGIAADEKKRLVGLHKSEDISYLEQLGYTQNAARQLCMEYDLLNPIYNFSHRLGCVRCPKQSLSSLRYTRMLEPEKWQWMLENDQYSPVSFKPGYTLQELEERFCSQPLLPIPRKLVASVYQAHEADAQYTEISDEHKQVDEME